MTGIKRMQNKFHNYTEKNYCRYLIFHVCISSDIILIGLEKYKILRTKILFVIKLKHFRITQSNLGGCGIGKLRKILVSLI